MQVRHTRDYTVLELKFEQYLFFHALYSDDHILAIQILQKQYQAHIVHAAIDYQMLQ